MLPKYCDVGKVDGVNWNPHDSGGNRHKDFQEQLERWMADVLNRPARLLQVLAVLAIVAAAFSSFYTVQPEEEAVVLRLGRYRYTASPGLHFKVPFGIDQAIKRKTATVLQESFGFVGEGTSPAFRTMRGSRDLFEESLMLTGDLNVADVRWVVHYQIADPRMFLFNVREPEKNIRDISQAMMRRVVGDRTVNDVLTVGREAVASEAKSLLQKILDDYQMGVKIVLVKLQDVNPPGPVQPSFNEVNAAKQEQEQAINRAEAAYNKVIPEARGKAEKEITQATGSATALLNRARGDAEKFLKILGEYQKAPQITRTRLYLEAIEELLGRLPGVTVVDPSIKGMLPVYVGDGGIAKGAGGEGRARMDLSSLAGAGATGKAAVEGEN